MAKARVVAWHALLHLERGQTRRLREDLDQAQLEPRDLGLARELAYGVERTQRFLDFVLQLLTHRGLPPDPHLRVALRLGAYQLLFTPRIAAHAAVFESVQLVRTRPGFANALLRRLSRLIVERAADPLRPLHEVELPGGRALLLPEPGLPAPGGSVDPLALRHSLPDFLVARWRQRFGAEAAGVCVACSSAPEVFLRTCGVHADANTLRQRLAAEDVVCEPTEHPRVLRWIDGESPFRSGAFRDGWFVAQDPTAVRAAEALDVRPGMMVVDLCAAPGTKTTLLAEMVRPDGVVFAFDLEPDRRERIRENVERLQLQRWIRLVERVGELPTADAVLADVPCSNTGVLARRVEVRRRLTQDMIQELAVIQRTILGQAAQLVRAGGTVTYSTCSIESEENEEVVSALAASGWSVVNSALTLPARGQHDGGYFAVLRRG